MPAVRPGGAKRLSASLCALLAVGLLAPTLAAAEWTTPVDLSASGRDAFEPQVAVDADGDAVFTWVRSDGANSRVQARARSAAGVLSAVQTLSKSGQDAFESQVAVDKDGNAVFTWRRFDGANWRVQARARSAAGTLSAVQTLSDPGRDAFVPQVAVRRGRPAAVFTWRRFDGTNERIQSRARSAAGTLSAVQTLSDPGQHAGRPQVAVDRDGNAVFTWMRPDGTNNRIQARARSAAGALSSVQTLSSSGQHAFDPQVAVDADGNAVFTWQRFDGTDPRIQARARSAAGTLSGVQNLSAAGQDAFGPQVAVDPDGDAVFTWQRFDGTDQRIQARARSAAGTLSAVQDVSNAGQSASNPQVAVDADGEAVFTWERIDETNPPSCCNLVEARTRSAAGTLRPFTTLSDQGQDAFFPQVGVDDDGDAVVTWLRSDGTNFRIQASAGP